MFKNCVIINKLRSKEIFLVRAYQNATFRQYCSFGLISVIGNNRNICLMLHLWHDIYSGNTCFIITKNITLMFRHSLIIGGLAPHSLQLAYALINLYSCMRINIAGYTGIGKIISCWDLHTSNVSLTMHSFSEFLYWSSLQEMPYKIYNV
jgi:hypothetical protein